MLYFARSCKREARVVHRGPLAHKLLRFCLQIQLALAGLEVDLVPVGVWPKVERIAGTLAGDFGTAGEIVRALTIRITVASTMVVLGDSLRECFHGGPPA